MIQQTSLQAYERIKVTGGRARAVYDILARHEAGLTAKEIMRKLGVTDPNHVRPRLTDMAKEGLVSRSGVRHGEIVWVIGE